MRRQTHGCLPSRRASLPLDRGTCCPAMLCEIGTSGPRTGDLSSRKFHSPSPLRHQATQINANHRPNANSVPVTLTANTYPIARERMSPPGGKGKLPPYGWTSKNYVICVCAFIVMELLRITRQIHCKAVEQRATLIRRQYNRDWGTSYSRPPIDPYLTSPRYKILAAPLRERMSPMTMSEGGGRAVEDKCPVMVSDGALFTACSE